MPEPIIVFTQVSSASTIPVTNENIPPAYDKARIVSLNYENREAEVKNLTPKFYSAASPALSFDNRRIVFSAKEKESDFWQIWTMSLDGSDKTKLYEGDMNCHTPSFLPTGDIVFSCEAEDPVAGVIYPLFKIQSDGSGIERLTFHPHRDLRTSMLKDGRIMMVSQQVYPEKSEPTLMVLRPDGTKSQAFYHNPSYFRVKSVVRESQDEKLIFVQSDGKVDELVALSYANPLLPKEIITSQAAGGIHSADIMNANHLVLSFRSEPGGAFSLFKIHFDGSEELVYKDPKVHSIQPVAVRKRELPKKLPTSISNEEGSGILISQDVNHSQINSNGMAETKYIRIEGIDKILNEIEVGQDGSFYLRVQSDMPVRFVSLDANKKVLRGPSSWVWLRTNERRACVGCHAKKEMTPVNRVPMAIEEDPVLITDTLRAIPSDEAEVLQKVISQISSE